MGRKIILIKQIEKNNNKQKLSLKKLFCSHLIKSGHKKKANKIFSAVLRYMYSEIPNARIRAKRTLLTMEKAIRNLQPEMYLGSYVSKAGTKYTIPINIYLFASLNVAVKWLISASRERLGKRFSYRLINEIIDAAKNDGIAIGKKRELYQKVIDSQNNFALIEEENALEEIFSKKGRHDDDYNIDEDDEYEAFMATPSSNDERDQDYEENYYDDEKYPSNLSNFSNEESNSSDEELNFSDRELNFSNRELNFSGKKLNFSDEENEIA